METPWEEDISSRSETTAERTGKLRNIKGCLPKVHTEDRGKEDVKDRLKT